MTRTHVAVAATVFTALAAASAVSAQPLGAKVPERGATYVEMGDGTAMVVVCCSVNADWMIRPHVAARVGAGASLVTDGTPIKSALTMIDALVGIRGQYLELGAGLVVSNASYAGAADPRIGPAVTIGYRGTWERHILGIQRERQFLRLTFTPILAPFAERMEPGRRFIPRISMSIGSWF